MTMTSGYSSSSAAGGSAAVTVVEPEEAGDGVREDLGSELPPVPLGGDGLGRDVKTERLVLLDDVSSFGDEGFTVQQRAVGAPRRDDPVPEAQSESALLPGMVVGPTKRQRVGEIGRAAIDPMHDMVGLDVSALGTAREPTSPVAHHQGPALGPV